MSFPLLVGLDRCVRSSDIGEFPGVFFKTWLTPIGMTGGLFTRVAQERAGCSNFNLAGMTKGWCFLLDKFERGPNQEMYVFRL